MSKTLEEAIGCWTTNAEYNALFKMSHMVKQTAYDCRRLTIKGNPQKLLPELVLLRNRLESMLDVTNSAIRRCQEIIETNEVA